MLSPSAARLLVSNLEPFNIHKNNWRLSYNHRNETYTPESRSVVEIIGALNFATAQAALAAIKPIESSTPKVLTALHPLARHFDYDIDAYEYNPDEQNHCLVHLKHSDTFEIERSVGQQIVGAFYFPKEMAKFYAIKLNNKEIVL